MNFFLVYYCLSAHQVFLSGPRFKGVKMLPPGLHFLSFQARSRRDPGTLSPPVSTFLLLQPRQVVVRRWDPASEGLVELEEEEVSCFPGGWGWGVGVGGCTHVRGVGAEGGGWMFVGEGWGWGMGAGCDAILGPCQ